MAPPLAVTDALVGTESHAGVEEKVRCLVARELHDRVAQTLTGMLVEVENFKSEQVGWHEVVQQLDLIQSSTRQVLASIRQLLHDLRGEEPLGAGFVDVVLGAADRFQQRTAINVKVDVRDSWPKALNGAAAMNLYRIIEEALANIRMHSAAQNVAIVLGPSSAEEVVLKVIDDGRGIDTDPTRPSGLGTVGMKERAMFLGGRLWIESQAAHGTTVNAVFPKALLAIQPSTITIAGRQPT